MAITIHYIDKNWNLIFKLIDMKLFTKIHNAVYLAEILNGVLKSFEIADKVHTYVFIFFLFFFIFFFKFIISRFFFCFFFKFLFKFIIDKAGNNLFFAKQFRLDYKYQYNINIYNVECVTYTFNNVVRDVVN